jgi:hypothetical protein
VAGAAQRALGNPKKIQARAPQRSRGATISIRQLPSPFDAEHLEGGRCLNEVSS